MLLSSHTSLSALLHHMLLFAALHCQLISASAAAAAAAACCGMLPVQTAGDTAAAAAAVCCGVLPVQAAAADLYLTRGSCQLKGLLHSGLPHLPAKERSSAT
jgi:di/tricarboxylate transporter